MRDWTDYPRDFACALACAQICGLLLRKHRAVKSGAKTFCLNGIGTYFLRSFIAWFTCRMEMMALSANYSEIPLFVFLCYTSNNSTPKVKLNNVI
ncbi:hypothetical protein CEXT_44191 [Caerostris extrusa]|uniref:Uncharacterized protein n=1 Tax=Caerostris extrusa TaxID=172846 RepID=A0AAV4YDF2_CAEEX|nr:hypothetical protein CEXT_44191 [Caerostris extrusa]